MGNGSVKQAKVPTHLEIKIKYHSDSKSAEKIEETETSEGFSLLRSLPDELLLEVARFHFTSRLALVLTCSKFSDVLSSCNSNIFPGNERIDFRFDTANVWRFLDECARFGFVDLLELALTYGAPVDFLLLEFAIFPDVNNTNFPKFDKKKFGRSAKEEENEIAQRLKLIDLVMGRLPKEVVAMKVPRLLRVAARSPFGLAITKYFLDKFPLSAEVFRMKESDVYLDTEAEAARSGNVPLVLFLRSKLEKLARCDFEFQAGCGGQFDAALEIAKELDYQIDLPDSSFWRLLYSLVFQLLNLWIFFVYHYRMMTISISFSWLCP